MIGDGAEAYHWFNEVVRQENSGSYITHGFLGDVGFGLGLSIGAQVAHPKRRVLCLAGDGAVGFNIAEFDTMVRLTLPIVVVVMNNRSWAASQHFQEMVSGANRVTHTQLGGARYDEVAKGFGAFGAYVTRIEDLAPALKAAFDSRQARLRQCRDRCQTVAAGITFADEPLNRSGRVWREEHEIRSTDDR